MLGWILSSEITNTEESTRSKILSANILVDETSQTLQKFWELEEVPTKKALPPADEACEKHFVETHSRLENGRYMVRLPFRNDTDAKKFGSSRSAAVASLLHLEKRFANDVLLKEQYTKCINEYLALGHMQPATKPEEVFLKNDNRTASYDYYYLPHHAVYKKDSTTTKLRVVFNASRKAKCGFSLNDALYTGPSIQTEMISVLLCWRLYKYAFIADVEKMYRQVKVHPEDIEYQRIVWRNDPNEEIRDYCLNTVTFGVTCAPFLAIRTLHQLASDEQEKYPVASESISTNFYVDDLLAGADSIPQAILKQKEIDQLLLSGGFKLRKWVSNDQRVIENVPEEDLGNATSIDLRLDEGVKSLGLVWHPKSDEIRYNFNLSTTETVNTKRELLSEIAKLYDPLGWITPAIISAKILMQSVWLHGLDWDETIPCDIRKQWNDAKRQLSQLEQLRINRWIRTSGNYEHCQIHAFSDASQRAYSAAVYLRTQCGNQADSYLLMAKSKVAPIKTVSIPRLELCGAVLAAKLVSYIKEKLPLLHPEVHMWTDSTIVLSWLQKHPSYWNSFVGNRISEIRLLLGNIPWHHISSSENPADLASRGVAVNELITKHLWWKGPEWLYRHEKKWPKLVNIPECDLDKRKCVRTFFTCEENATLRILQRFSSLMKLLRVTAYCYRFVQRAQRKQSPQWLTFQELNRSLIFWIRFAQSQDFPGELVNLCARRPVDRKSKLLNLNPVLDENNLIRVGGRLTNANLSYNERHPIIISKGNHLTYLILKHVHETSLHGGVQLMQNLLRKKYWLLDARNTIRHFIHKCVTCYRQKAQTCTQLMGNLPSPRITRSRPFTHTGIDYCGPVNIKLNKLRGSKSQKGYIAIFICLSTKAVHIEAVSDLSSVSFIAALRRFCARRGLCAHIYSDCGTNFVGANTYLKEIYNQNQAIAEKLANEGIEWHFIPPLSPHFGGLWEAAVKSAKYHLRRVVGNACLTFEELSTVLSQVEACMNSRPLCPITSDPEDLTPLTPGHFVIGDALLGPPDEELLDIKVNRLSRWQLIQQMMQHFWSRWSKEYLAHLQQRPKWMTTHPNIKKGDMVLVKQDKFPPYKWPLGRILEVHTGQDGFVRVVTVRTRSAVIKRPIAKISVLPISDNDFTTEGKDSDQI